ncbi:MAG: hypothetical protein L0H93_03375 [Nocardioides sp.]|nr:hypothetical protein [Nocardioides sp.]
MPPTLQPPETRRVAVAAHVGWVVAVLVVAAAITLPDIMSWEVHARNSGTEFPPLHGYWEPTTGPGTWPALLLAVLGVVGGRAVAASLPWRWLLMAGFAASLAWLLALALVDGQEGLTRVLGNGFEYLGTARGVSDIGGFLDGFIDRIPNEADGNWPIHVAGHPAGATLFFVGLVRIGLGDDLQAALVVTVIAATIPAAVMVALRALAHGEEEWARRATPFLVFSPAAVFLAVSADAVFAACAAWGLAALAVAAVARSRRAMLVASVAAGLLLGACVSMSYGLPLLGILALAVLWLARSWWPLPVAAVAALAVVLALAAWGFAWWEAFPVLVDRYWDGIASDRPTSYWVWANIAALLISMGPMVGAGLAHALSRWREALPSTTAAPGRRVVLVLALAAVTTIVIADSTRMSKGEVERIWLPFIPWLTVSLALLPERWQRPVLALQLSTALLVQHLLYTSW